MIDKLAGAPAFDAKLRGKPVLVDARMHVQIGENGILERRQARVGERLGDDARANLVKAARQGTRCRLYGNACARRPFAPGKPPASR